MQQPTWKRLLSYCFDFHIETLENDINDVLHVLYSKGRYQLNTANAIYSYGDLYSNYRLAFDQIDLAKFNPKSVLILGFGLGSIPFMMERKYGITPEITGVELDEDVLYLAHKYVTHELKAPMNLVCADAYLFLENCEETFDLIAVDIFLDDQIPTRFQSYKFLRLLQQRLSTDGLLMYNRLSLTFSDKKDSRLFYRKKFLTVFPEGHYLDVDGNWMFMNKKVI